MSLNCGLIGLPGCGKTVIFNAITAAGVSSYSGSEMNRSVISIPDKRIERLSEMYHPQKKVHAILEVVDIPGLKSGSQMTGRSSQLLTHVKNVDALVHVVRCFEDDAVNPVDPVKDIETIDLELMIADSTTLDNKITRLAKKLKAGEKEAVQQTEDCTRVYNAIQQGIPARRQHLDAHTLVSIEECNLVSLKPVLYVANIKNKQDREGSHVAALTKLAKEEGAEMLAVYGRDEADISQLGADERMEFLQELGLEESVMERLLNAAYRMLGLISFFTVGEDEVRAWTCHKGDKAPVAAGKIHTDMEKGFIRMEVFHYEDLIELGSENAVAKAGKKHTESREYEVQDGDIVQVLFNSGKR